MFTKNDAPLPPLNNKNKQTNNPTFTKGSKKHHHLQWIVGIVLIQNNNSYVLFYVLFLQIGAHSPSDYKVKN